MGRGRILAGAALAIVLACGDAGPDYGDRDFRAAMRELVMRIASRARATRPGFLVIPQNGLELLTLGGDAATAPATDYLAAIDGVGQENLHYGYDADDVPTAAADTAWLSGYLAVAASNGIRPLVTDYCSTPDRVEDAYERSAAAGYPGFVADSRELDRLPGYDPPVFRPHALPVTNLAGVSNFCYLINPAGFADRAALVDALDASAYDLFIVDLFFGETMLSAADVAALATKPSGARRLVICYMSIGEAEDYRYYWEPAWDADPPAWLDAANPDWPGNYKVRYWEGAWQEILCGEGDSYLARILAAGFDGIYLDIIDAFEHFEGLAGASAAEKFDPAGAR